MVRRSNGSLLLNGKSFLLLFLFFVLMLQFFPKISGIYQPLPDIITEFIYFDYDGYTQIDYLSNIMVLLRPELPSGYGYEGCTITIERPDGSIDIIPSVRTHNLGSIFFTYRPPILGEYYLRTFSYPGGYIGRLSYSPLQVSMNQYLTVGPEADTSPPEGSVFINNNDDYSVSESVILSFTVQDQSTVDGIYVSNDNIDDWSMTYKMTWFRPELDVRRTLTWNLTIGDGQKYVYVRFVDAHGVEAIYFDTIILDTTPPDGSIQINNNDRETYSTEVNLSIPALDTVSGLFQMRFSNEDLVWSNWEPYNTQKEWNLSGGDGVKTVTVQFQDNAGNLSPEYSDIITLNTTTSYDDIAPTGSISINRDASETNSTQVILFINAQDSQPGTGVSQMRFSNEDLLWSNWEAYNDQKNWMLSSGEGTKRVRVQFQDGAGNLSPIYSDTIILNQTLPKDPLYSLSVSLSSLEIISGENVKIIGILYPALSGVEISVQCRYPGDQWQTIQTLITNNTGGYSCVFSPSETGSVQIRTCSEQFLGNQFLSSNIELLAIAPTIDIPLITLIGSVTTIIIVSVIVALTRIIDSLRQASNILSKVLNAINKENYKIISEQLEKSIQKIKKAISSGKLPSEINYPPYSLEENLEQIIDLFTQFAKTGDISTLPHTKELKPYLDSKNLKELLEKSGINDYINGIKNVIENYRKIKKFITLTEEEQESKSKYCVTFISSFMSRFENPLYCEGPKGITKPTKRDFWFRWKGDIEPVKIEYKPEIKSTYRWHWKHFDVKPYLDNQKRIQIMFPPHFHTPCVRPKNPILGLLFQIYVRSFMAEVYDGFILVSRALVSWSNRAFGYYANAGKKTRHKPDMEYKGWTHADK